MNPRRNITFLTLGAGAGRARTAEVLQRAIQDGGDNLDLRTLDGLELGSWWFRHLYAARWAGAVRAVQRLWQRLFRRGKQIHPGALPDWIVRRGCREVHRRLRESPPHLVIATEAGAAEIAALGKRQGWCSCPILAVQTELEIEPSWVRREIDVYTVVSEEARAQLIARGVSPNRVVFCGFPIDPAFSLPFDEADVLQALGLDARRPVVLVMGSGCGPAPLEEIILQLERCALPLQVVAVCGQDRSEKARLESRRGRIALDLHVFGWTDMIPELMAAADLLVTKPGGVTTAEALTVGLPMILTPPVPGLAEAHARRLEQCGAAVRARAWAEIPLLVEQLLGDRERLVQMSRQGRELGRPDAAHAIAQVARALLETASYIEFLAAPPARSGESAYLM
jgi:processive 1,2-diacylglycerol beta-glucosyltransferase